MTDLEKERVNLQDIERKLNFYSNFENLRQFEGKAVYRLHEQVRGYISQPYPSEEARQKAHGNLLWMFKNYYYRNCFQKEVISLVNANTDKLDLSEKDKINYLSYILSMKNYQRFSVKTFQHLGNFNCSTEAGAAKGRHIFNLMCEHLQNQSNKPEEYKKSAERFYSFFSKFADEVPQVTHKLVEEYTDTLFDMSAKFPFKTIPLWPLKKLAERTVNLRLNQAKMNSLFGDEPQQQTKPPVDKKAIKAILKKYVDFSLSEENKNNARLKRIAEARRKGKPLKYDNSETVRSLYLGYANLYHSVANMMCYMVQNYDYTPADVRELREILGSQRVGSSSHRSRLYDMGKSIHKAFKTVQPRTFNPRNKTIDPVKVEITPYSGR